MPDKDHLEIIKRGVRGWNRWRLDNPGILPALSGANLTRANLRGANLRGANLRGADLRGADLSAANLSGADLSAANLTGADLFGANLTGANLTGADLFGANLTGANLFGADLFGANLTGAVLGRTILGNVNLTNTEGLDACRHLFPSIVDHQTLQLSGTLPTVFLRGCGLPDALIDYLPSIFGQPSQFHSCFISYSAKDQDFAKRLHLDLQNEGVRCWFAPHDMKIGAEIRATIDDAIRNREKLLLVISKNSVDSNWVKKEVETAFEEEERRKMTVLFPVRLDDVFKQTATAWAADIRRMKHIGDFRRWKDPDKYKVAFERLLRDLRVQPQNKKP